MQEKIKRNTNFELLRIITMIMIIALHYNCHGQAMYKVQGKYYYVIWLIEILCLVAVNCYVLISGYFLVNSKFNLKKLIKIVCETFFYSFFIALLLICSNKVNLGNMKFIDIIKTILPSMAGQYWFITVYIMLYLIFPFLNIIIKNINKKQFQILLIIAIGITSIITSIFPFVTHSGVAAGRVIIWFIILYFIGAYIRLYSKEGNKYKYLMIYLVV